MKKLLFSILALAMFWSCGKDDSSDTPPASSKPTISSFAPKTGPVGTEVTITGTNFSTTKTDNTVKFGGTAASVSAATATQLKVVVPTGATTGKISVAVDGETATSTDSFTVAEADPENQSPVIESQEFSVIQTITPSDEIGQVEATDPEGDNLTFNIIANDNDLFNITEKGILSLAEGKSLDFESAAEHVITIGASDGNTTAQATITINVLESDPDNQSPVMDDQEFTVSGSITDADEIGQVVASDPEENDLTFSMVENDNDLFAISDTGMLTLAEGKTLDYQAQSEHSITVGVSDGNTTIDAVITILVEPSMAEDPTSFVTQWKTEANNEKIYIGANADYDYAFTIDWGDGTVEVITEATPLYFEHTYDIAGTYSVAIQGNFPAIDMKVISNEFGQTELNKLIGIEQWGSVVWKSLHSAFRECKQLKNNAKDSPDLSVGPSMYAMFYDADAFDGNLSGWDTSKVTDMSYTFADADSFDGDLSGWDTSNVTNMKYTFSNADSFNGNISTWHTSKVTSMESMFFNATSFNGDISNWDTSNVTSMKHMFSGATFFNGDISNWNTSNVTSMANMFFNATFFNGDISNWDVSKVKDMSRMFNKASAFNRNIGNWDISKVTNMQNMLDNCGMIPIVYGVTLQLWAQDANVPSNITLGALGLQVDCSNEPMKTARDYLINTEGWTINDNPCP